MAHTARRFRSGVFGARFNPIEQIERPHRPQSSEGSFESKFARTFFKNIGLIASAIPFTPTDNDC